MTISWLIYDSQNLTNKIQRLYLLRMIGPYMVGNQAKSIAIDVSPYTQPFKSTI